MISIKEIKFLNFALLITVFLNSVDLVCTWIGLKYNLIEELNPLMKYLFNINLFAVIFFKLTVAILLLFIFKAFLIQHKIISRLILFPFIIYISITLMHVSWLMSVFKKINIFDTMQIELISILLLLFLTIVLMFITSVLAAKLKYNLKLKQTYQKKDVTEQLQNLLSTPKFLPNNVNIEHLIDNKKKSA